ncbi:ArsR/SmtB family transcription factor [Bradyrhizobium sp. cf659]|uniref:ArsR/SmtB family transcription factor n=1 Tax=Bradyrhizobium sp. cf659 TaxID=1761771 RepID=UPI000B8573AE|nr:metalloregulator ArsR/SmtB family transcription factor [Bradyrhizobium sp. cf659]
MQLHARGFLLDGFSFASILNHMVKYQDETLDRTFAALSDPTRRALLARLGEQDSLSVSELAAPFPVSLPAIMKHLDVLTDAGLIVREKTGRTVSCRLTAQPMEQAMNWLNRYAQFWSDNLDRLAAFVEEETWPTQPSTPIPAAPNAQANVQANVQASRSRAGSARGRKKSTPPGRKPRS